MGVFEDFCGTAKDMADAVGKKTGEIVEISKYKLQANQLNSEIRANYEKLGHSMHSMAKSGYENPELIESIVKEIDDQLERLDKIEQKIAELKNVIKCSCCGANNSNEAAYCSKCGCKLASNRTEAADIAMDAVVSDDESGFHE